MGVAEAFREMSLGSPWECDGCHTQSGATAVLERHDISCLMFRLSSPNSDGRLDADVVPIVVREDDLAKASIQRSEKGRNAIGGLDLFRDPARVRVKRR